MVLSFLKPDSFAAYSSSQRCYKPCLRQTRVYFWRGHREERVLRRVRPYVYSREFPVYRRPLKRDVFCERYRKAKKSACRNRKYEARLRSIGTSSCDDQNSLVVVDNADEALRFAPPAPHNTTDMLMDEWSRRDSCDNALPSWDDLWSTPASMVFACSIPKKEDSVNVRGA